MEPVEQGAEAKKAAIRLAVIVGVGWLLRAAPLMRGGGAFGFPVDYDEGVYFSSAALLVRGMLPYRDFVFVHPPGLLYFLAPMGWLASLIEPASAFGAARWVATFVGAINIALLGRVVGRAAGPVAALAAAAFYAVYPDVVTVERGPFLEPVLNLVCLLLAWVWLRPRERSTGQLVAAGALLGAAVAVKLWGALWLASCMATLSPKRRGREAVILIAVAGAVCVLLVAPLAVLALDSFAEDAVSFHLWRPRDGTLAWFDRARSILGSIQLTPRFRTVRFASTLLALLGIGFAFRRIAGPDSPQARAGRFFAPAYILITTGFLLSATYWDQYNAHLAVAESALAGLACAALWESAKLRKSRAMAVALATLITLGLFVEGRRAWLDGRQHSLTLVTLGRYLRQSIPNNSCVIAFEPAWGIAGDLLPSRIPGQPLAVDPYAMMLLDAYRSGERFADTGGAFQSPSSQRQIQRLLDACRFVVMGGRGRWQLSRETQQWLAAHFVQRFPSGVDQDLDVWERAR